MPARRAAASAPFPLTDRIDAFITPRYARIHAVVRFRIRRAICAFSLPRTSLIGDNRKFGAGSSASGFDFFVVTVNNRLRNRSAPRLKVAVVGLNLTGQGQRRAGSGCHRGLLSGRSNRLEVPVCQEIIAATAKICRKRAAAHREEHHADLQSSPGRHVNFLLNDVFSDRPATTISPAFSDASAERAGGPF